MIIRNEEHKRETVEGLLGGSGKAYFKRIIEAPEGLYNTRPRRGVRLAHP